MTNYEVQQIIKEKFNVDCLIFTNSSSGITILIQDRKQAQLFMDNLTNIEYTINTSNREETLQEYNFLMWKEQLYNKLKE